MATLGAIEASEAGADGSRAHLKTFISVGGMTCAACSGTVERALQDVCGVSSGPDMLMEEVEDVGFEASLIDRPDLATDCSQVQLYTEHALNKVGTDSAKRVLLAQEGVVDVSISVLEARAGCHVSSSDRDGLRDGEFHDAGNAGNAGNASDSSDAHNQIRVQYNVKQVGVRDLVRLLSRIGVNVARVRTDGDMKARRDAFLAKRQSEMDKWKKAFTYSMMFTIPVILITMVCPFIPVIHGTLDIRILNACTVRSMVLLVLVTPVQFGIGRRFYVAAYKSLKHGSASMDVLIVLGSSSAYIYSFVSIVKACSDQSWHGRVFFETSAMLISIVLLGRFIENKAKGKTSQALTMLMDLQPTSATLLHLDRDDPECIARVEQTTIEFVQYGDILKVDRGATIPVDGQVILGTTSVDESLVTGEALPIRKQVGDTLIGGTMNLDAPIRMRALGVGSQTMLAQIVRLVEEAQTNKAPIQAFADRVARVFVPSVVLLSVATFFTWYGLLKSGIAPVTWRDPSEDDFLFAFMNAVAVMVISCPCALGLATPTAVMVGSGVGARLGILFKGGQPLEVTGETKCVLFDKTGTLTVGRASVDSAETTTFIHSPQGNKSRTESKLMLSSSPVSSSSSTAPEVRPKSDEKGDVHLDTEDASEATTVEHPTKGGFVGDDRIDEEELWSIIGAVESQSEHLLASAICDYARIMVRKFGNTTTDIKTRNVLDFHAESARGVCGRVSDRTVVIGNREWLHSNGVELCDEHERRMVAIEQVGHMAVAAAVDGRTMAIISISDPLKPEAPMVVQNLVTQGIDVFMITGDNRRTALSIGEKLGLNPDKIFAQVAPKDKADIVHRMRREMSLAKDVVPSDRISAQSGVMFVGDGVNDSPAIAAADIGLAVGGGTDVAIETASVVLMRNDLTDVLVSIDLSRATLHRIKWNFRFALVYNMISIPLAAGVLYPLLHTTMPPALAAAAMGCSSISVVMSSLLLKWYKRPKCLHRTHVWEQHRDRARLSAVSTVVQMQSLPESHDIGPFDDIPVSPDRTRDTGTYCAVAQEDISGFVSFDDESDDELDAALSQPASTDGHDYRKPSRSSQFHRLLFGAGSPASRDGYVELATVTVDAPY